MPPTEQNPPRTFSLGLLMRWLTVICVVCGLAANFPDVAAAALAFAVFVMPTVIVLMILSCFIPDRQKLSGWVMLGAFLGFLYLTVLRSGHSLFWVEALAPAVGAMLVSLPGLFAELRSRHRNGPDV
jgi:hypothetical protein